MDIHALLLNGLLDALKPLWWLLPLLLLLAVFKSAIFKGWLGETLVRTKAARQLDSSIYRPFHDLIIPDSRGTTQLDHIYLSRFGIFVVETKHYRGWIYGSEQQARWTQVIYKQKHSFQNPLRQNYRHIKALSALLGLPENCFHSVIVFSGDYRFKTPMPANICDLANFSRYIENIRTPVLDEQQINTAAAILSSAEFTATSAKKRQHIRTLHTR